MLDFSKPFIEQSVDGKQVYIFQVGQNLDAQTVSSFGQEWQKFNSFSAAEIEQIGADYFDILPKDINQNSIALDVGCGTGRWAAFLSSKVGFIECIDPSDAVYPAARLLQNYPNVRISKVDVENIPFADESFDLVYSLGVLHHIPDPKKALAQCFTKIKPGDYLLIYLYYNLDNRGVLFRTLFAISNLGRKFISKLPSALKRMVCDILAVILYLPFVLLSRILRLLGVSKAVREKIPLNYYEDKSFHIIRNDSLDRFGTPLEQRFSKDQILQMLQDAGLTEINFSTRAPFWHVIARKT